MEIVPVDVTRFVLDLHRDFPLRPEPLSPGRRSGSMA